MILNPGTQHFDFADGSPVLDITDYPSPGTLVDSLTNDPSAVLS